MKFLFKYLIPLTLISATIASYIGYMQYTAFQSKGLSSDVDLFEITKGSSIAAVANKLERQNIVKPALFFRLLAKIKKQETKIKAGEYALQKGMTPVEILGKFTSGKTIQYQTQILEGQQYSQIVKTIREDKNLIHTLSDDDFQNIMKKLNTKFNHVKPEGMFLPDTYSYPRNTTDLQFLQRSHDAMLKYIRGKWENHQKIKGIDSIYKVIILASIIEKETGDPVDRGKVARVFINRLKKNMMLQTDPTVIYGMGEKYDGNIRKKDLTTDTPYNTYTRVGLPPTPIATPSKASIDAVFNPDEGEILYFVAKGDGTSHFSKSYKEHKKAVIQYLLNGNANKYQGDK